jgi:hypothetical protein
MKNVTNSSYLSPIDAVNATTGEWRVEPLPSNLTVFNSSIPNHTIINGHVYNGSAINGTTIIVRFPSTHVGGISMVSFIYMIISLGIIGIMAFPFTQWIRDLADLISSGGGMEDPRPPKRSFISEKRFRRRLREIYPTLDHSPQHSYEEKVPRQPGGTVTSQDLRECRELIRSKYALDVWLYNARDAPIQAMDIVDDNRRRSDGALVDIQRTVRGWVAARAQWSPDEWEMVSMIDERIRGLVQNVAQAPAHRGL